MDLLLSSGSQVRSLPGAQVRGGVQIPSSSRGAKKGAQCWGALRMAEVKTTARRGYREDAIYFDTTTKNRYIGAVSLGFGPNGRRIRKKVIGKTKVEVRDKLRQLHRELDTNVRPRQ